IRARVPESPAWLRRRSPADFWNNLWTILKSHWVLFLYVILLMTAFNAMSHGTQDMYQTFLGQQRGLGVTQKATIGIIYSIGAMCGGTIIRHFSQKFGRRRSIILSSALGVLLIPASVFSPSLALFLVGVCA